MKANLRISLTEENFRDLVAGKTISHVLDVGDVHVEMCLRDIGYQAMTDAISAAQAGVAAAPDHRPPVGFPPRLRGQP
jgi:hypothetical protein